MSFVCLICSERNIILKKKAKFNTKKIILTLFVLISVAGIFASMYLSWSSYKLYYVDGVQGRYFIPLLLVIALLVLPKKEKLKFSRVNLYLFINILFIQYIIYAITYFY